MSKVTLVIARLLVSTGLLALFTGCSSTNSVNSAAFIANHPRSILVLPVNNGSNTIDAPAMALPRIPIHFLNLGYYVLDPALTNDYFLSEGAPTPAEIEQIDPGKFKTIFGADAVLYTKITEWDTTYIVINTHSRVTIEYKLVDTRSGQTLWEQEQTEEESSGGGSLVEMVANAAVNAVVSQVERHGRENALFDRANRNVFYDRLDNIYFGPYHPLYTQDYKWE
jgi:hypothetical protein